MGDDEIEKARQKVIDVSRKLVAIMEDPYPRVSGQIFNDLRHAVYELDGLQPPGWGA